MPPHDGDHHDHDGDDGDGPESLGLPVHRRRIRPGAVATGCGIAAAFALAAQFPVLFAGDGTLAGGGTGAPAALWLHAASLLLHAANAALVYLLFANLTKRKLGAPLIAAVLFAVHPIAADTTARIAGRGDMLAAFCGLLSAVLLVRSAADRRLAWWSAAVWGLGLFANAGIATTPLVVAAGLVAYHEVEPKRLASARLRTRFLVFAVPALAWVAVRAFAPGDGRSPAVVGPGPDAGLGGTLQEAARAAWVETVHVFLPVGLGGDGAGAADLASRAGAAPWDPSPALGILVLVAAFAGGLRFLRRHAAGFPLLAYALALVPALLATAAGPDAAGCVAYLPAAFLLLLVAEGLESLYYRWGALLGLAPALVLFAVLAAQSHQHLRAEAARTTAPRKL